MRPFGIFALAAGLSITTVATAQVELSEIRISQSGPDTDRFIEFVGDPGTSVDAMTVIVISDIEGAFPPSQNGGIEMVVELSGSIPKTGVFILAENTFSQGAADQVDSIPFELFDNLTIMLVEGFNGAIDDDVDTDNDGVIDTTFWTAILDSVALVEDAAPDGFNTNYFYSDNVVGPVNGQTPAHAWKCSDSGVWRPGQDSLGGADENPGAINATCSGGGGGEDGLVISEWLADHSGSDLDEFFELRGDPNASLDGITYIVIGDDGSGTSGHIESATDLTGHFLSSTGYFVAAEATFTLGIADLITSLNFENSDTVTHAIVLGYDDSITDIDIDDDGVIDTPAWTEIIDSVTALETCEEPPTGTEWGYSDEIIPPNGTYVAGGAYRCEPDGTWVIGDYNDTSIGYTPGTINTECAFTGCGGLARSCYETNEGPGCSDVVLCAAVCDSDPLCCSGNWDGNCVSVANNFLVSGPAPAVGLSEIRTKMAGEDNNEYIELDGEAGVSLNGLSIVILGSDGCELNGVVVEQYNLIGQAMPSSGFFVLGDETMTIGTPDYALPLDIIDSGNMTIFLAWNFTGAKGQDLDLNNDCVLDSEPWDNVITLVGTTGDASGNCTYLGAELVGPDGDYTVAHIYSCNDGNWDFSNFDVGLGTDTPGEANPECGSGPSQCGDPNAGNCYVANGTPGCNDEACCTLVSEHDPWCGGSGWDAHCAARAINHCLPVTGSAPDVELSEIRIDHLGVDVEEYVEIRGDSSTSLDFVSLLVIGDGSNGSGTIETVIPMGGQVIASDDLFLTARDTLTIGSADYTVRASVNGMFENGDNVTFMLVFGFNGFLNEDIDSDDDGVIDYAPWSSIIDSISLIQTEDYPASGNWIYSSTVLGPDIDEEENAYVPGHSWRCQDGSEWNIGIFDIESTDPPIQDTPGEPNADCGGGPVCPGDFDNNGTVDGGDFGGLLASWGSCPGCPQDLNTDGSVDGADVGLFLSLWGDCP